MASLNIKRSDPGEEDVYMFTKIERRIIQHWSMNDPNIEASIEYGMTWINKIVEGSLCYVCSIKYNDRGDIDTNIPPTMLINRFGIKFAYNYDILPGINEMIRQKEIDNFKKQITDYWYNARILIETDSWGKIRLSYMFDKRYSEEICDQLYPNLMINWYGCHKKHGIYKDVDLFDDDIGDFVTECKQIEARLNNFL